MTARNRHGLSPSSPMLLFRTAAVDGKGFVSINLPPEYDDSQPLSIKEIRNLLKEANTDENNSEIWKAAVIPTPVMDLTNTYWIIMCATMTIVVLILLTLTIVFICRCQRRHAISKMNSTERSGEDMLHNSTTIASMTGACSSGRGNKKNYLPKEDGLETNSYLACPVMNLHDTASAFGFTYCESPIRAENGCSPHSYASSSPPHNHVCGRICHLGNNLCLQNGRDSTQSDEFEARHALCPRQCGTTNNSEIQLPCHEYDDELRNTPIDSDLDSCQSIVLPYPYPYRRQNSIGKRTPLLPLGSVDNCFRQAGPFGVTNDRLLSMKQTGIIGSVGVRNFENIPKICPYSDSAGTIPQNFINKNSTANPLINNISASYLSNWANSGAFKSYMTPVRSGNVFKNRKVVQTVNGPGNITHINTDSYGYISPEMPETEIRLASSSTTGSSCCDSGITIGSAGKTHDFESSAMPLLHGMPKPKAIHLDSSANIPILGKVESPPLTASDKIGKPVTRISCCNNDTEFAIPDPSGNNIKSKNTSLMVCNVDYNQNSHNESSGLSEYRNGISKNNPSQYERNSPRIYSTEELTKEMENLEGLMKDLSTITQNDFNLSV